MVTNRITRDPGKRQGIMGRELELALKTPNGNHFNLNPWLIKRALNAVPQYNCYVVKSLWDTVPGLTSPHAPVLQYDIFSVLN